VNPHADAYTVRLPGIAGGVMSLRGAGDMGASRDQGVESGTARARFLSGWGLSPDAVWWNRQVHSRRVVLVTQGTHGVIGPSGPATEVSLPQPLHGDLEADGIIVGGACETPPAPAVTVADCMPIYLYDRVSGSYALLHSGWKGTGILDVALHAMTGRLGVRIENLQVLLGPSIGSCCYRVDEARAESYAQEWGLRAVVTREDGSYLDLREANLGILERWGVRDIIVVRDCTVCGPAYSSFRQEGPGEFAHMLALLRP
jgi:hypothetical protein